MVTEQDLALKSHSYRNWEPHLFIEGIEDGIGEGVLLGHLKRIEGGRFEPMLRETSEFFGKLDRDEMDLFTRRNPDLVRWMGVWNRLEEFNPYTDFTVDLAREVVNNEGFPVDVPPFERKQIRSERSLLQSMYRRRRSYRNWAPSEFMDIIDREVIEVSRGQARDIGLRTPEIRDGMEFPREFAATEVARELLGRIEAGRFKPAIGEAANMYFALDVDEAETWAQRNPGVTTWQSVWGRSEDLRWRPDELNIGNLWPLVPDVGNGGVGHNSENGSTLCRLTADGRSHFDEIARQIEAGKAIDWRDNDLSVVGEGLHRIVVEADQPWMIEGATGCIVKFAKDYDVSLDPSGEWPEEKGAQQPTENTTERENWEAAPPGVREVLAPVVDHATDDAWLVMPKFERVGKPVDLVKVEMVLEEHGWRCQGLHAGSVGMFDGQPKAFDYGLPCIADGQPVT